MGFGSHIPSFLSVISRYNKALIGSIQKNEFYIKKYENSIAAIGRVRTGDFY
jgi:hypothetical protein